MSDPAMDLSVVIRSARPVEAAKVDQLSIRTAGSEQPLVKVSVVSAEQALRSDPAERRTMFVG